MGHCKYSIKSIREALSLLCCDPALNAIAISGTISFVGLRLHCFIALFTPVAFWFAVWIQSRYSLCLD